MAERRGKKWWGGMNLVYPAAILLFFASLAQTYQGCRRLEQRSANTEVNETTQRTRAFQSSGRIDVAVVQWWAQAFVVALVGAGVIAALGVYVFGLSGSQQRLKIAMLNRLLERKEKKDKP